MLHGSIFEKEMQKDPEDINCLDYKEYPLVDESELIQMKYFLYRCGGKIYISSYVSHNSSGKNYVEIYVWEDISGNEVYKRFIICEGCRLNIEDERDFFIILMKQLREIQLCEETEYYQITLLDLFPEIMSQEAYKMYN